MKLNYEIIVDYLNNNQYEQVKKLIEEELSEEPDNHWLITHLGLVYLEEGKHLQAINYLIKSDKICPDCPLTLWYLGAANFEANKVEEAIDFYKQLLNLEIDLKCNNCWESLDFANSLKLDAINRLGCCYSILNNNESTKLIFKTYLYCNINGIKGSDSNKIVMKLYMLASGESLDLDSLKDDNFDFNKTIIKLLKDLDE